MDASFFLMNTFWQLDTNSFSRGVSLSASIFVIIFQTVNEADPSEVANVRSTIGFGDENNVSLINQI
jgi:hypothetical protein